MSGAGVSVVVPTFGRPRSLLRCLEGLARQTHLPDEVLVVRRVSDDATAEVLTTVDLPQLREVLAPRDAVVAAMEAGVAASIGNVVAFTDDDAVPRPDWIEKLLGHLTRRDVGAVGGRDIIYEPNGAVRHVALTNDVGRIDRFGRLVGNHHSGSGSPRLVDVLKGVNMAFRREALAFPVDLWGHGTQLNFEVAMCLWARRHRWRIVYDPAVIVDHYAAPRSDSHSRDHPPYSAVRASAYNLAMSVLSFGDGVRVRRAVYGALVGDRGTPGLARAGYALAKGDLDPVRRLPPSLHGQMAALVAFLWHGQLRMRRIAASEVLEIDEASS